GDGPGGGITARAWRSQQSPRWQDGRLGLLESGTGRLLRMDMDRGTGQAVAELPGFARGLALIGPYAFIGLSKIRETSAMNGVPLAERRSELKCGIGVVDLSRGRHVALLEFQSAVEEIFDVQLLPGLRFPEVLGFQKDAIANTFIVPRETETSGRAATRIQVSCSREQVRPAGRAKGSDGAG